VRGERAKVRVIERFWVALMLREVMFEAPICHVCDSFNVARGTLQVNTSTVGWLRSVASIKS